MLLGFPVLRLRGDYLAIVTLAFGEIIRLVLINWTDFSGGSAGIRVSKCSSSVPLWLPWCDTLTKCTGRSAPCSSIRRARSTA